MNRRILGLLLNLPSLAGEATLVERNLLLVDTFVSTKSVNGRKNLSLKNKKDLWGL